MNPPRRLAALLAAAVLTLATARAIAEPAAPRTTELGHGPTIVFVHSLGSARIDWLPTARRLFGRYRVVLVDLPGHGESPLPDPFSFASVGDALDQVLAKQDPDSTIVVGHALGGRAVITALAAHPGLVKGLILIDVPVATSRPMDDRQKKQFFDYMDQYYDKLTTLMFSNMGRDTTQSKAIYAAFSQTAPVTVKAYVREMMNTDGNKDARALKIPVEFVFTDLVWKDSGTTGRAFKESGWEDTTAAALHIQNAGFWVMKDQPDTLAAIISEFATARITAKK